MRRCLPLYLTCVCLVLILLNADLFGSVSIPRPSKESKRSVSRKRSGVSATLAAPFPKKIWQTWKVDPLSFDPRDSTTAQTWTAKNPEFRYEVLTDSNDLSYIEQHFGPSGFNRMDIVKAYQAVNATIIKADLLRYLIMYAEGGVYADIDVEALRPVHRFIPERYNPDNIDMVIGVEIDQPHFKNHPILGKKSESFCQWTFMCKPHLPVMLRLVENIITWLDGIAQEQSVPISEVVLDFDQVISGTGPSAFTAAVLEEMNAIDPERVTTWSDFHDMDESKIVSRVLVLDVEAFAAGQGHSDSGNHNARGALVKHHYHASNWPSRHPRYSHPVYGEVERCNWNVQCVQQWDSDVEAFKVLSPEEQQKKVAERQEELRRWQQLQQFQEQQELQKLQEQQQQQLQDQQQQQQQQLLEHPQNNQQQQPLVAMP
ncbi:Glycosyltransferase family 32 protein [Pleurostoma richardsiae]|uniref:Glycosyltransferase family 32 protein n=1 Tax=Pleurostoma richardsiae TaxID=41990 RepID=A0AA38RNK6_9PEZI|nr:Glycosyltransferase family 32 protein [Pleurostoma richardsiae]